MSELNIDIKKLEDNIHLISLDGILNTETSESLFEVIQSLFNRKVWKLVVDLSSVSYMGSPGVGLFISVLDDLEKHKGTIVFIHPQENVKEVFKLFKLSTFYTITNNLQDALKELKELSGA